MRFVTCIFVVLCTRGALGSSGKSVDVDEDEESEGEAVPQASFEDLLKDEKLFQDAELEVISTGTRVFVSDDPISIRSEWKRQYLTTTENCFERLIGFETESFDRNSIRPLLESLRYKSCKKMPGAIQDYDAYKITPVPVDVRGLLLSDTRIDCQYTEKKSGRRFAARRQAPGRWISEKWTPFTVLSGKLRNRAGTGLHSGNLSECRDMLNTFIYVQNAFITKHYDPEEYDVSGALLAGGSSSAKKTSEKDSNLGAGYIVLIIVGALAVLGGTYYAYSQWSSKSSIPTKKERVVRKSHKKSKRGETQELKDDEAEYSSDPTEAQNTRFMP